MSFGRQPSRGAVNMVMSPANTRWGLGRLCPRGRVATDDLRDNPEYASVSSDNCSTEHLPVNSGNMSIRDIQRGNRVWRKERTCSPVAANPKHPLPISNLDIRLCSARQSLHFSPVPTRSKSACSSESGPSILIDIQRLPQLYLECLTPVATDEDFDENIPGCRAKAVTSCDWSVGLCTGPTMTSAKRSPR